jgi:hypothetical protein
MAQRGPRRSRAGLLSYLPGARHRTSPEALPVATQTARYIMPGSYTSTYPPVTVGILYISRIGQYVGVRVMLAINGLAVGNAFCVQSIPGSL